VYCPVDHVLGAAAVSIPKRNCSVWPSFIEHLLITNKSCPATMLVPVRAVNFDGDTEADSHIACDNVRTPRSTVYDNGRM